jgi:hypothetical protein
MVYLSIKIEIAMTFSVPISGGEIDHKIATDGITPDITFGIGKNLLLMGKPPILTPQ